MTKEVSMFQGGNSLVSSDLLKQLLEEDKNLRTGGGGGNRRISVRGGRFRQIVGGEQVSVSKSNELNVVILKAAQLSRQYYEGTYNPDEAPKPPVCWSHDTRIPAVEVTDEGRQSANCAECPQNVKGSGAGESRACRFSQRVAVALEGDYEHVYQLQLPATSIFGDAVGGNMPMGAYARYLQGHNTPSIAIITQIYFDENSDVPKLFFKAVRPLEEEELNACLKLRDSEEAVRAVTLTVSQTDGVEADKPAPLPKPKPAPKVEEPEEEEDEEPEEPKKATRKRAQKPPEPEAESDKDLSAIISDWDDE